MQTASKADAAGQPGIKRLHIFEHLKQAADIGGHCLPAGAVVHFGSLLTLFKGTLPASIESINRGNNSRYCFYSYIFTASTLHLTGVTECEFEEKLFEFSPDFCRRLSALSRLLEKVGNSQTKPVGTRYLFLLAFQGQMPYMTGRGQLNKQLIKIEENKNFI